eukprot:jgi/Botrbrau1/12159/Bobra.0186s0070.1
MNHMGWGAASRQWKAIGFKLAVLCLCGPDPAAAGTGSGGQSNLGGQRLPAGVGLDSQSDLLGLDARTVPQGWRLQMRKFENSNQNLTETPNERRRMEEDGAGLTPSSAMEQGHRHVEPHALQAGRAGTTDVDGGRPGTAESGRAAGPGSIKGEKFINLGNGKSRKVVLPRSTERGPIGGQQKGVGEPEKKDKGVAKVQGSVEEGTPEVACPGPLPTVDMDKLNSDEGLAPKSHICEQYTEVCVDQQTFVLHDPKYSNMYNGTNLPEFNLSGIKPCDGEMQSEWQPWKDGAERYYRPQLTTHGPVRFRPPIFGDADPVFSFCTLPIVLHKGHVGNFNHFVRSVIPHVHAWASNGAINGSVTFVLDTIYGSGVPQHVRDVMRPYTRNDVASLADFSSRLPSTTPSPYTAEGTHTRGRNLIPANPVNFSAKPTSTPRFGPKPKVRVLIEERQGTVRTISNLRQLLDDCNSEGNWECRPYSFGSDFVSGPDACRDLGALHSADVVVFMHGAGCANMAFMRSGTAAVELMAMNFVQAYRGEWFEKFFPHLAQVNAWRVQHFSLSVQDPSLNRPSGYEKGGLLFNNGNAFTLRDMHISVPWKALKQLLVLIGSTVNDVGAYKELWKRNGQNLSLEPDGRLQRMLTPREMQIEAATSQSETAADTLLLPDAPNEAFEARLLFSGCRSIRFCKTECLGLRIAKSLKFFNDRGTHTVRCLHRQDKHPFTGMDMHAQAQCLHKCTRASEEGGKGAFWECAENFDFTSDSPQRSPPSPGGGRVSLTDFNQGSAAKEAMRQLTESQKLLAKGSQSEASSLVKEALFAASQAKAHAAKALEFTHPPDADEPLIVVSSLVEKARQQAVAAKEVLESVLQHSQVLMYLSTLH